MNAIASSERDGESDKGEKVAFHFALNTPHQIDDESWGCTIRMEGFTSKPLTIIGVDSWQSLTLAIALIQQSLTYFIEDGGRLFFKDSASPMDIQDVALKFPSKRA
ncbi:hypothetical protein ACCQ05_20990 [Xanthomonas sp. NCPPB 3582]|uniref:hypothetical protein n=1 Tax=Xanthomonas sp. NCPPB 3582 TaxID=487557 RepID=UPI003557AE39